MNLVPVVYCSVISEGSDEEWEYLWSKFQAENVAAEQVTILNALGCTKQTNLIKVNEKKKKTNSIITIHRLINLSQECFDF